MKRIAVVALVLVTSATVAIACSTFTSEGEPALPDGGDAGPAVPSDAATPDAPAIPDAAPPFCRGVDAQFCWSFDEGLTPLLGQQLVASNLQPTLTDASLSAPSAMLAALQGAGGSNVSLKAEPKITALRCELDILFQDIDSANSEVVTIFQLEALSAILHPPRIGAQKQSETVMRLTLYSSDEEGDLGNAPIGTWVHLILDSEALPGGPWLTRGSVANAAELVLDGGARDAGPGFTKAIFGLGTFGTITWRVRYDNLVCTWH